MRGAGFFKDTRRQETTVAFQLIVRGAGGAHDVEDACNVDDYMQ